MNIRAPKRPNVLARNTEIKERFKKLKLERKFSTEYIIAQLAKDFYLAERTIEDIVLSK